MIKIKGRTIFSDVDDTLLYWDSVKESKKDIVTKPYYHDHVYFDKPGDPSIEVSVKPIYSNIGELKKLTAQGFSIVVWSAGGEDWAEAFVKAVGLEPYVTAVVSKPQAYYDDLPCEEFMGKRRFKPE